ncbi:type II toxin-antitoxin system RnlA family toxin [Cupriavidus sp. IK-TO18]|nr:type II toxin-antitoxin system RnlA family toxin [Cupriavidus sp. IK-TO18]
MAIKEEKQYHCSGTLADERFLLNIYANKDGSTTLGFASGGNKELFEVLATEVREKCAYSDKARFELSVPKMNPDMMNNLSDFLAQAEAKVAQTDKGANYELTRYQGRSGDVMTVKQYSNGTVQFQGKYAQVATLVMDFLQNELSLTAFVEKQIAVCNVDIKAKDIVDELKARYPATFDFADEKVKKQFSAALTLEKLDIELEDYSAVAFPALRGLEGIIKQMLIKVGFKPAPKDAIGQYFEQTVVGKWRLTEANAAHAGIVWTPVLSDAYTVYFNHRHPLFHMESMVETTKTLPSIQDACQIVESVMHCAEHCCQSIAGL